MELRKHQSLAKTGILADLKTKQTRSLMALCTGGGKTITAQAIIKQYLRDNPSHRVLVLTHGQKIVRDNFTKHVILPMYTLDDKGSASKAKKAQVVVTLPQTARAKDLGKFNLAVIDEAHQFYGKAQVDKIVKAIPRHLLLTASHGKFDPQIWTKYHYSVLEGYTDGVISKTKIELVNCGWDFSIDDFTASGELRKSVKLDSSKALEVLDEQLRGLYGVGQVKKTLIACRSIPMAKHVFTYFNKRYPDRVILSDHKSDPNMEYLNLFSQGPRISIAIVVDRGVIGFDLPELEIVVDMTCTRDIERIRQLMGRGMRVCGRKKKTYLKVMPEYMEHYTVAMMACVVALMFLPNDMAFRGNYKLVPLIMKALKKIKGEGRGDPSGGERNTIIRIPEYILDFEEYAILFERLKCKSGRPVTSHSFTTLAKVEAGIKGILLSDPDGSKQAILDWMVANEKA